MSFNHNYNEAKTPEEHRNEIELLCEEIKKSPLVDDAIINDFGRYSNFDIHIYPVLKGERITLSLKSIVTKAIKSLKLNCKKGSVFPAYKKYETVFSDRRFVGYDRSYWAFDVDYNSYDKGSNTFSEGI